MKIEKFEWIIEFEYSGSSLPPDAPAGGVGCSVMTSWYRVIPPTGEPTEWKTVLSAWGHADLLTIRSIVEGLDAKAFDMLIERLTD